MAESETGGESETDEFGTGDDGGATRAISCSLSSECAGTLCTTTGCDESAYEESGCVQATLDLRSAQPATPISRTTPIHVCRPLEQLTKMCVRAS